MVKKKKGQIFGSSGHCFVWSDVLGTGPKERSFGLMVLISGSPKQPRCLGLVGWTLVLMFILLEQKLHRAEVTDYIISSPRTKFSTQNTLST